WLAAGNAATPGLRHSKSAARGRRRRRPRFSRWLQLFARKPGDHGREAGISRSRARKRDPPPRSGDGALVGFRLLAREREQHIAPGVRGGAMNQGFEIAGPRDGTPDLMQMPPAVAKARQTGAFARRRGRYVFCDFLAFRPD